MPVSQRFSPDAMAARYPWRFLALVLQGVGLLLVFLGTAIMIAFGYVPISCVGGAAASCTQSNLQSIVYGIDTAHLLWTVGLFGIAAGCGLQLQFRGPPNFPSTPEETRVYIAHRRGEFAMLVISVVLLFVLMLSSTGTIVVAL
jgi:hypothetical protein